MCKLMRISIVIASLCLAVSALAVPSLLLGKVTRVYSDLEAYEVYSAILPENIAYRSASAVIIREETISYSRSILPHGLADCLNLPPTYRALVNPAMADGQRVNRLRWRLARLFPISKPYEFAPAADFRDWWYKASSRLGEYIRNHPNFPGFVELSAVGFNESKTIAVVYMTYKGGDLGGGYDILVFRKQDRQWKQLIGRGFTCFGKS